MPYMDMPMDYHVWDAILEHYRRHVPKLANIMPESPLCRQYRTICFTPSLIRQYHFATDFDRVLLQLVGTNIVNTLFKYSV